MILLRTRGRRTSRLLPACWFVPFLLLVPFRLFWFWFPLLQLFPFPLPRVEATTLEHLVNAVLKACVEHVLAVAVAALVIVEAPVPVAVAAKPG